MLEKVFVAAKEVIMMEDQRAPRQVPSGKVYRQIFDAEVQLVKALDKGKTDGEGEPHDAGPAGGMLTHRQKTWMQGYPNENDIENPVLYRHNVEEAQEQMNEPEEYVAQQEVQGLPDVISPSKKGSDIIERIAESRKERHEMAVEEMHQELGLISSDVEPRIEDAGQLLIGRLSENDLLVETLIVKLDSDERLLAFSMDELVSLWDDIAVQSITRQRWIADLDTTLAHVESERMLKVREIFGKYAEMLGNISHFMAPDLQRLLDKESQLINQTVLSNRRAYGDLFARLMITDIEREKKLHTHWLKRVQDWKQLKTDSAVQNFIDYMGSPEVTEPPEVQRVFHEMRENQEELNSNRMQMIQTLGNFKPPSSTKTAVYEWNKKIVELSKDIDRLNQNYFSHIYEEYEHVLQGCLAHVDQMKKSLIEIGACSPQQALKVANDKCLPLVGDRQTTFEQELEAMDKNLEEHTKNLERQLRSLFKYIQGAAHVWDVHELGLAKQERALHEKLDECRRQHDSQNQDREANLDIVMDRMRQDATEQALKDSLKRAVDMLSRIQDNYHVFHKDQLTIVESYPDMVKGELHNYDASVCKFFGVERTHPDDAKESEEKDDDSPSTGRSSKGKKKKSIKQSPGRSDSQASDLSFRSKTSSPMPLIVSDILNTDNGSTFYVLTVAGEHGPPPASTEEASQEPAFLTEATVEEQTNLPAYIQAVNVSDSMLLDIKKLIRMNFLNHLESWQESAAERSLHVLAAKSEELNSELDLRLHLHQPRARRAELDIHNVRAAELVMHSERVTRHCKGINQALNELRHKFNAMTVDHNNLTETFRSDIEEMEIIFINAKKSAKLVSLSNQLQEDLDKYMKVIRQSLREFRKHLDNTLQMLRESNANFIKSFKLFSDGGNFCPEEVEEYRKRLEKMAQKIDSAEGFVMADLEGMESKRLDQATKIAAEFEDRFKNHMVDLLFIEKIARWLTNTQVKIKSEVADSNSQAKQLAQMLNDLDRRIDACQHPNPDKEKVTPMDLNQSVQPIFEASHKRSVYLNCIKEPKRPESGLKPGSGVSLGARVNFTSDAVTPISKPGKQPAEDSSVGVIRNILRTQKTKLRFGLDAEMDGDQIPEKSMTTREPSLDKERSKTSRPSTQENKANRSGRRGTTHSASTNDTPKRSSSATRRLSKGQKGFDRKGLPFGEKEDENEDVYFLGKINHILRDALDGLIAAAELYYRQKGNRAVTRPEALQETFELCTEIISQKLWSYYNQTDEYHNQCLQEYRSQLWELEHLVSHVPDCVIQEVLKSQIFMAEEDRTKMDLEFNMKLSKWRREQSEHKQFLRPTLGHPQQSSDLQELCEREATRRDQCLDGVCQHSQQLQELSVLSGQRFIEALLRTSEDLLMQFDDMLIVDDIKKGRVAPTKYPTSELIRRKNAGVPLLDDENKNALPRGRKTWTGIPSDELQLDVSKDSTKLTDSVTTAKTSLGHSSTTKARDKAYQEYFAHFKAMLVSISDQKDRQIDAEQRWTDSWITSVHKVQKLYDPTFN